MRLQTSAARALVVVGVVLACAELEQPGEPVTAFTTETVPEIMLSEGRTDSVSLPRAAEHLGVAFDEITAHGQEIGVEVAHNYVRMLPARAWAGVDTVVIRRRFATQAGRAEFRIPVRVLAGPYAIRRNPYAGVAWSTTSRWKVQLHDHPGVSGGQYLAYDAAGYHAVVMMDYSGVPSLPYAWRVRHWPPENWLSPVVLSSFRNIRTLIPAGEEVGYTHLTSPFLAQYIEKWEPTIDSVRLPWHYTTPQEAVDLIRDHDGFAIIAHPWGDYDEYWPLVGYAGLEIYSAFAASKRDDVHDPYFLAQDRNVVMRRRWDRILAVDATVVGVAVNDHFGPGSQEIGLSLRNRDSGKTLVFANSAALPDLLTALRQGRALAVEDHGDLKDQYPRVDSVWTDQAGIYVETTGEVRWIANGQVVGIGAQLLLTSLPAGSRYARFEIRDESGSVVYSQAIALRLVGDQNDDGLIDAHEIFDAAVRSSAASRGVSR